MSYNINANEHAAVTDSIEVGGRTFAKSKHKAEIIGEVEILCTSRYGKSRFTKTIKDTMSCFLEEQTSSLRRQII